MKPSFTERPVIRQEESGAISFEVRLASEPEPLVTWYVSFTTKQKRH